MIKLPHKELYKVLGFSSMQTFMRFLGDRIAVIEELSGKVDTVFTLRKAVRYMLTQKQALAIIKLRGTGPRGIKDPDATAKAVVELFAKKKAQLKTRSNSTRSTILSMSKKTGEPLDYLITNEGDVRISCQAMSSRGVGAFRFSPESLMSYVRALHEQLGGFPEGGGSGKSYINKHCYLTKTQWEEVAAVRNVQHPEDYKHSMDTISKAFKEASTLLAKKPIRENPSPEKTLQQYGEEEGIDLSYIVTQNATPRISHRAMAKEGLDVFSISSLGLRNYIERKEKSGDLVGGVQIESQFVYPGTKCPPNKHAMLTERQWLTVASLRSVRDKVEPTIKRIFDEALEILAKRQEPDARKPRESANSVKTPDNNVPVPHGEKGGFITLGILAHSLDLSIAECRLAISTGFPDYPLNAGTGADGIIDKQTAFAVTCAQNKELDKSWGKVVQTARIIQSKGGIEKLEEVRKKLQVLLDSLHCDVRDGKIAVMDAFRYIRGGLAAIGESRDLADILIRDI